MTTKTARNYLRRIVTSMPSDESHWRTMALNAENTFLFTNREAAKMLSEIDRLRAALSLAGVIDERTHQPLAEQD